jgi:hypothetical protein
MALSLAAKVAFASADDMAFDARLQARGFSP